MDSPIIVERSLELRHGGSNIFMIAARLALKHQRVTHRIDIAWCGFKNEALKSFGRFGAWLTRDPIDHPLQEIARVPRVGVA